MPSDIRGPSGRRLPPLSKFIHPDDMPDRYALTGVGRCMEPLIEDGACCAFTKLDAPAPGDVVGVIFTQEAAARRNAPGMIKRLVIPPPPPGFAGELVVEQVNPPRTYRLPSNDVLAVHKFIGVAVSMGDGTAGVRLQEAA